MSAPRNPHSDRGWEWLREVYAGADVASQPTLVLISQVYVPDPAAVGQYMHQAAAAMAARGWRVISFAADSGYEDPNQRFSRYERVDGVHVVRLPCASFGKTNLRQRLLGGSIFTSEATLLAAALPRIDRVLISTSPPMVGAAGIALSRARRAQLSLWVMDINPDQIVASGRMSATALPVRGFDWLNERTFRSAHSVITLDAAMADRLQRKSAACPKPHVLPLWPVLLPAPERDRVPSAGQAFRREHGLEGKRVVMYSGNLSPLHPVDTLLEAAKALQDEPRLAFVFIGGGSAREHIARYAHANKLRNLHLLPYQPLSALRESLSAADVHLVAMGAPMVGIVHPSKIYSAMAVGRAILALGPRGSHIADLVHEHRIGWHVEHGAVGAAVAALQAIASVETSFLAQLGERARRAIAQHYDQAQLIARFCGILED
jgi:colanic acid biosynthesis glycosyl transferase WcaI